MIIGPFLENLVESLESESTFKTFIVDLQNDLDRYTKVIDSGTDLEALPASIQYWLAKKADLEFYKRSLEKQMRVTSIPQLLAIIKKGSYVSSKLMDAALESLPEYSFLAERVSYVQYVLDLIQSGVTSMWFKRDALVNLSANRRKQFAAEQFEY
jgi:hypothetical protein